MNALLPMNRPQPGQHGHRQRGVALLLVLIAVAVAATLATSFLSAQNTSVGIARNLQDYGKARYVAESGLELAIAHVRANATWRTDRPNGTWVTGEPFAGGTFTIVGEDGEDTDGDGIVNGDGSLSDDPTDPVTITVTGKSNGTTHIQAVVLYKLAGSASFIGENANDKSGKSVAGVGDVNGDGIDDFIIGAEGEDTGGNMAGKTYLILGKVSGWSEDTSLSTADASFVGENANDKVGKNVSGAGDVNSDGYSDFLIGAEDVKDGGNKAGKTYLILGKAAGWTANTLLSGADASYIGEKADDKSAKSVDGAGDVNNDGYDDFLIGAEGEDTAGNKAGKTYLVLGKAAGWSTNVDLSTVSASFTGVAADDKSGKRVAGVGDVNADGYDDILIAAKDAADDLLGNKTGVSYLILGKAAGWAQNASLSTADASFVGEAAGEKAGEQADGVGDVNGDGFDDFMISAPDNDDAGNKSGKTYLILGKATGWTTGVSLANVDASFLGLAQNDKSGKGVAGVGDSNGDGFDDFVIGAEDVSTVATKAGAVYLILGKASGWTPNASLSTADTVFPGENVNDKWGKVVAGIGDVNGDGRADFAIGAENDSTGGTKAGKTTVMFAGQTGSGTAAYRVVWEE